MTTLFKDIQQHAYRLASHFAERDSLFEDIRRVFHLEWADRPTGDWIKETLSPSGYNAVIGAVRLMTSTEPQITAAGDRVRGDKLERAARAMWDGSTRIHMRPPHYDLIFSGVLYGEAACSVNKTADLLEIARAGGNKGQIARATYIAGEAPYLFESYNPATCYPDRDVLGLRGMLRKYKSSYGEVMDQWGEAAREQLQQSGAVVDRLFECVVYDWYDWEQRCVWVEANAEPVYHEDHGLPFLPVGWGIVEGSHIFDKPELQRLPLLYGYFKSGMWQRENLSLTTIFTLIHALATNPQLIYENPSGDDTPLRISREMPGGITRLPPGAKLQPFNEKVLDPSLLTGLGLTQSYAEESTISKQALGAPPKDALAFSAISLLVQAGRLPLMGVKQVVGGIVASVMNNALRWYKEDAEGVTFYSASTGDPIDITPEDIPDRAVVTVSLDPDLPQDKLQMANVAASMLQAGIADKAWVREHILGIGQSDEMDERIWMERRLEAELETRLMEVSELAKAELAVRVQEIMAEAQARKPTPGPGAVMGGLPGGMGSSGPGGGMAPRGGPPGAAGGQQMEMGMMPEQAGPYPPGGVGEGAPLNGPLPVPDGQGPME